MEFDNDTTNYIKSHQNRIDLLIQQTLDNKNNCIDKVNYKNSEFDDIDSLNELSEMYLGEKIFKEVQHSNEPKTKVKK